jgi:hypothetical protein
MQSNATANASAYTPSSGPPLPVYPPLNTVTIREYAFHGVSNIGMVLIIMCGTCCLCTGAVVAFLSERAYRKRAALTREHAALTREHAARVVDVALRREDLPEGPRPDYMDTSEDLYDDDDRASVVSRLAPAPVGPATTRVV